MDTCGINGDSETRNIQAPVRKEGSLALLQKMTEIRKEWRTHRPSPPAKGRRWTKGHCRPEMPSYPSVNGMGVALAQHLRHCHTHTLSLSLSFSLSFSPSLSLSHTQTLSLSLIHIIQLSRWPPSRIKSARRSSHFWKLEKCAMIFYFFKIISSGYGNYFSHYFSLPISFVMCLLVIYYKNITIQWDKVRPIRKGVQSLIHHKCNNR